MNIVEKIIALMPSSPPQGWCRRSKASDALFALADVRFSHEYVTPMAESLVEAGSGSGMRG